MSLPTGESMLEQELAATETPAVSSSPVPMRPGRNGGRLRSGNPGNAGRRPFAIRQACRDDFDGLRARLVAIARSRRARDFDRVKAIEVLGRFGLGDQRLTDADVRDALVRTTETIRDMLPENLAAAVLAAIATHWIELG